MDVSIGELIGAGTIVAGVAAAFGTLSYRIRALEKGEPWRDSAKSQGTRLGEVEDRCAKLEGFMLGMKYKRRQTKSLPIGDTEDAL